MWDCLYGWLYVRFVYVSIMHVMGMCVWLCMCVIACVFPYMYSLLASLALTTLGTLMRADI